MNMPAECRQGRARTGAIDQDQAAALERAPCAVIRFRALDYRRWWAGQLGPLPLARQRTGAGRCRTAVTPHPPPAPATRRYAPR